MLIGMPLRILVNGLVFHALEYLQEAVAAMAMADTEGGVNDSP
jgi:hypothetical protein